MGGPGKRGTPRETDQSEASVQNSTRFAEVAD